MYSMLKNILKRRGLTLRRTGNLIQVRSQSLSTVFQSHSMDEIELWAECLGECLIEGCVMAEPSRYAVKYSRTTTRP